MVNNTEAQALALVVTPKITSFISFPCSMYIIYQALIDHRRGKGTVIQRALVGMSVIDLFASSGWFLSTWAVRPSLGIDEEDLLPLTSGNRMSCNYQGFLLQLAIGAPLYNGTLALYSLLMVRYNWKDHHLRKIEPFVHFLILGFTIGTSIAGLVMGMYNPVGNVCWVIGEPADCGNSSSTQNEDVPCVRGDWAWVFGVALFYGPLWIMVALVVIAMTLVMGYVRSTFRKTRQYAGSASARTLGQKRNRETETMKSIAIQSILYSASFIVTWMPSTIWSIAHWFSFQSFLLNFAASFCEPLQGFWNCCIFLYKRDSSLTSSSRSLSKRVSNSSVQFAMTDRLEVFSLRHETPQEEHTNQQTRTISANQVTLDPTETPENDDETHHQYDQTLEEIDPEEQSSSEG